MVKLEIKITGIAWRGGQPRFVPSPEDRKLGAKGESLRHPGGAWYTPEEALVWSQANAERLRARRAEAVDAKAAGKRLKKPVIVNGRKLLSVEDLFEEWFNNNPKMRVPEKVAPGAEEKPLAVGKRKIKALSPSSIASYRHFSKTLGTFDGDIFTSPVEALKQSIVFDLYERLWEEKGLATARGIIATLSASISWGMRKGKLPTFIVNPCKSLGMTTPDPRVRCLTPEEVTVLIATADRMGRPEIGDAVMLGVWTGQRQGDRLQLVDAGLHDGRRLFKQGKTGAIVEIPDSPMLAVRLEAARARRATWPVPPIGKAARVVLDENLRTEFKGDWYRHLYMAVRDEAAKALPSLADARDQDLRDTAVTWLARAACTLPEIASITGHSPQSITAILKHYLAQHRELADNAIAKMVKWYEEQEA